ncbi:AAA family ATPase [Chryseomicrobium palamuruense]|uniref:Nuclease SbcCD subunit C n=1 Tax=Chryseomicrobium palamuruense TaxID=682973 RepID=A0ABV8UR01_9BACL
MRPLYLKMTAFGPYREQETIDFSELHPHTLFVIAGPTGAGKTSIFDALSFALFGTGSGEDRQDTRMLRSDFAPDELHTAVELTFSVRGRTIRIFRQMAHIKTGNKTATGEKYELVEVTPEGEVPLVERYTVREINAKLMELVGMTAEQFHQIVMLPQGEFRKFLTSSTDQKELILRKLFRTERFQRMNEFLREKRQQLLNSSQQHRAVLMTLVSQAAGLYPEVETFKQHQINLYQIDDAFTRGMDELKKQQLQATEIEQHAWTHFQVEQKRLQQMEWMQAKRVRLEELVTKHQTLINQQPLMEKGKARLEAAERAQSIAPVYLVYKQMMQKAQLKQEAVQNLKQEAEQVTIQFTEIEKKWKTLQAEEEKRQDLRRAVEKLEDRVKQLEQRDVLLTKERSLAKEKELHDTAVQQMKGELQQMDDRLQFLVEQYQALTAEADGLTELEKARSTLSEQLKQLTHYEQVQRQIDEFSQELLQTAQAEQQAKEEWQQFQKRQANQLAVQLVEHLHDGAPCPVCGATEHPSPAVREEEVSEHRQAELQQKLQQVTTRHMRLTLEFERLQKEAKALEETYPNALEQKENYEQQLTEVTAGIKGLNEKKQQASAYMSEGKPLRQQSHQLKDQMSVREQQLARVTEEWQRLQGQLQSMETAEEESLEDVKQEARKMAASYKQAVDEWQQTDKTYHGVKERFQSVRERLEWEQNQLKQLQEEKEQAVASWEDALQARGFENDSAYTQASLPEAETTRYKEELQSYETMIQQVMTEKGLLEKELEGHEERVPVADQRAFVQEAKATWDTEKEKAQKLQGIYEASERLMNQFAGLKNKMGDTETQLATTTSLYDALRGQNNKKLSFERYMLIAYLEQITEAANQRLQSLSGGQFRLVRSDRQESHGKQSGLQLDVYDGYTGQFRDVKSLSGGEKFHASLSLALGMADVMQEMNGGIQIETMFIDEGFGSLDEESLQKAIDALVQLQRTGRLIGVISHVKELQAAIPAQLRVQKSASGTSSTSFQIG